MGGATDNIFLVATPYQINDHSVDKLDTNFASKSLIKINACALSQRCQTQMQRITIEHVLWFFQHPGTGTYRHATCCRPVSNCGLEWSSSSTHTHTHTYTCTCTCTKHVAVWIAVSSWLRINQCVYTTVIFTHPDRLYMCIMCWRTLN